MNHDALWLSIVSGLMVLAWGDHLYHAGRLWAAERSLRSFRNLFIAVMLEFGMLRIWLGATVRAAPGEVVLARLQDITAPVLSLLILSGAIVIAYTWHRRP